MTVIIVFIRKVLPSGSSAERRRVLVTLGNCTPMTEPIQPEPPDPGAAWTEIVGRPTLEEFSRAFASDVVLEASVVSRPIVGPVGLWAFFQATRAMYERIGFTHEIGTKARMRLEWEGVFAGKPVVKSNQTAAPC